jgi:hypothetical protein
MEPMNENQRAQIEIYLSRLAALIRRGHQLIDTLANDPSNESAITDTLDWQEELGVTVNQLSGGSKAHWLALLFSGAFLMRLANGHAVERGTPAKIVERLLGVLEQAVASLSRIDNSDDTSASEAAVPTPRHFNFVHNAELRLVVEQAYTNSQRVIEQGNFDLALITFCGILEAIVTDALEHIGPGALAISAVPAKIADWSFETRLAAAERAGLIRGGYSRLPAVARTYRDHIEGGLKTISERDARKAAQVLRVVMRDLDPGR